MSEWQPAIIGNFHKEVDPTSEWQLLIGKKVRVRETREGWYLDFIRKLCPSAERAFLINVDDVYKHTGIAFLGVSCEHDILTD